MFMVWEANERKRYILLQARSMASFKKRDKKACLRIVKSLYFVGVGGGCICIYMYLYMYWQFDPQFKWRTNTTSCRGSRNFSKRGGGVGGEGTGMRNMNIVVSSHGRESTYMYVGADSTECTYWACFEMMEVHASSWIFFQGGRGWSLGDLIFIY